MKTFSAAISIILTITALVSSLPVPNPRELAAKAVEAPFTSSFSTLYPTCFLCRMSIADKIAHPLTRLFDADREVDSSPRIVDMETEEEATIRRLAPFRNVDRIAAQTTRDAQLVLRRGAEAIKREFNGVMAALTVAGMLADD